MFDKDTLFLTRWSPFEKLGHAYIMHVKYVAGGLVWKVDVRPQVV